MMKNKTQRTRLTTLITCMAVFCSTGKAQTSGSIQHDGLSRTYELYVPTSWSAGQSFPLLFVLHGTTQDGARIRDISDFNTIAEANNIIAVYPDGIGGSWNTGIVGASTADDLGFIEALAVEMITQYGIDTNSVYSCGFSAGGYFSYRLACESTRCFAAVGSVSGTMMPAASAACSPNFTTPIIQIHGTTDFVVSYNGSAIAGLGAEDVIAQWNGFNNCATTPVITQLPNTSLLDFSTVEQQVWSPCDLGTSNILLKVNGGGHQWPGTSVLLGGVGTTNQDIDASQHIWDFFSGLSCSSITTGVSSHTPTNANAWYDGHSQQLHIIWTDAPAAFSLVDAAGRVVHSGELSKGENALPLSGLQAGMFTLLSLDPSRWSYQFIHSKR